MYKKSLMLATDYKGRLTCTVFREGTGYMKVYVTTYPTSKRLHRLSKRSDMRVSTNIRMNKIFVHISRKDS